VLAGAQEGRSGVLLVRGAPGIGKSALLEYATQAAGGFRLVRAVGVESEMELAFPGLQQLCAPLLEGLAALPEPQRLALETVFGLALGAPPDPLFVGLGVLSLLSNAGSARPLLAVVDDVQWLDRASAQALGVVARRLDADAVALVLAARDGVELDELVGVKELRLEGLADGDARALLVSVWPGRVDDQIVDRILAETEGNPLALLELPRGLSLDELAGGFGLLEKLEVPGRIERSFRRRLRELPAETRTLLLVASAEPVGDAALLWRACELLGIDSSAAGPAESADLIRIGTRLRFYHPLVRSAIYAAASPEERRRAHAALAEVTDAATDPDRRAWHRAEALSGPDEEVARELERSADRARSRGGEAAAAAFLKRSAELTIDPAGRSRRALAAAGAMHVSGALDAALALLATAEAGDLDELQHAQAVRLRGEVLRLRTEGREGALELATAAELLAAVDPVAASDTYVELLQGLISGFSWRQEIAARLTRLPLSEPPTARQLLLHGFGLVFSQGFPHGTSVIAEAVAAYCATESDGGESVVELSIASQAALNFWDAQAERLLIDRALTIARLSGSQPAVETALATGATGHLQTGRIKEAAAAVHEAVALRSVMGLPAGTEDLGGIAALRDDEDTALRHIAEVQARWGTDSDGSATAIFGWHRALLYNGLARFADALAAAKPACEVHPAGGFGMLFAELIEAASRSGELALARDVLERLAARTQLGGKDWGLGTEGACRALLSDGADAERLYLEAIGRLARVDTPLALARAHLVYGEWLRRGRRRRDARGHLQVAHDLLDEIGARSFAARARHELAATGVTAHSRRDQTLDELTPQEARIASLAGEGQTNGEIAARLYISPSTVDYHLKKVFRKLGVHSRTQLHGATAAAATT
jgi:DNA-binding CsgD family transcriptional regulator